MELPERDTTSLMVATFKASLKDSEDVAHLSGKNDNNNNTFIQINNFDCSGASRISSTVAGHSGNKYGNMQDFMTDQNCFAEGGYQRTCMGLKHKWQHQWRMQSASNYDDVAQHFDNLLST